MHWVECTTKFCTGKVALHLPFELQGCQLRKSVDQMVLATTVMVSVLVQCGSEQMGLPD